MAISNNVMHSCFAGRQAGTKLRTLLIAALTFATVSTFSLHAMSKEDRLFDELFNEIVQIAQTNNNPRYLSTPIIKAHQFFGPHITTEMVIRALETSRALDNPNYCFEFLDAIACTQSNLDRYLGIFKNLLSCMYYKFGHEEFSKLMFEKDKYGRSILNRLISSGSTDVLEITLSFIQDKLDRSKILELILSGDSFSGFTSAENIKLTLDFVYMLDFVRAKELILMKFNHITLLLIVTRQGNTQIVKYFIDFVYEKFGIETTIELILQANGYDKTMLHIAVIHNHIEIVKYLLPFVTNMLGHECFWELFCARTWQSGTACLEASCYGYADPQILMYLFTFILERFGTEKAIESLFMQACDGCTILHLAAYQGKVKIVEYILDFAKKFGKKCAYGLVSIKNHKEKTALDYAKNVKIKKILLKYQPKELLPCCCIIQ